MMGFLTLGVNLNLVYLSLRQFCVVKCRYAICADLALLLLSDFFATNLGTQENLAHHSRAKETWEHQSKSTMHAVEWDLTESLG